MGFETHSGIARFTALKTNGVESELFTKETDRTASIGSNAGGKDRGGDSEGGAEFQNIDRTTVYGKTVAGKEGIEDFNKGVVTTEKSERSALITEGDL
jgi:hypothetical protein